VCTNHHSGTGVASSEVIPFRKVVLRPSPTATNSYTGLEDLLNWKRQVRDPSQSHFTPTRGTSAKGQPSIFTKSSYTNITTVAFRPSSCVGFGVCNFASLDATTSLAAVSLEYGANVRVNHYVHSTHYTNHTRTPNRDLPD